MLLGTAFTCQAASSSELDDLEGQQQSRPRRLDSSGVSQFLTVGKDRLTVSYKGNGQHPNDVGSIRSDAPVPGRQKIYYYEVTVLDDGERRKIGVGFADKKFKLQRQPGWDDGSYGYHGENGCRWAADDAVVVVDDQHRYQGVGFVD